VQLLFHIEGAGFHQQPGHLVLHAHRFAHHQAAIAQQAAQFANPRRGYIAGRQKIAAHQVGDGAGVDGIALLLARADGFHLGGMRHLQLLAVRLQRVVDPTTEQRRFQRSPPRLRPRLRPLP